MEFLHSPTISTDVLIIGGGMSGLAAAIRLSRKSRARYLIVEKSSFLGGSSRLSAGMFWAPRNVEIAHQTIPGAEPELLSRFIEQYPDAVQWMRDNEIETHDQFNGIMSIGIGFPINIPQWLNKAESIIKSNNNAQILLETSAIHLVQEAIGVPGSRVKGALLRQKDGSMISCSAGAVIIATGGFQGSPRLVAQNIGPGAENLFVRSNPYSTGDGFNLGCRAGSGTSRGLSTFYGHLLPSPMQQREVDPSHFIHLAQFQSGYAILVNRNGRRFCDETMGDEVNNQEVARQPGQISYMVFNDETRRRYALGEVFPNAGKIDRLDKAKAFGGRVTSADSVDDLIWKISEWGVPTSSLKKTIAEYNAVVRGDPTVVHDAPVGSNHAPHPALDESAKGPFWALEVQPSITFSYGGLKIDCNGHVLDGDARVIPGLFASGMDAGGFSNWRYGGGLAQAFVTGTWAAESAINELGFEVELIQ